MEFISKFKDDMEIRGALRHDFVDTYAKMISLEAIIDIFNNITKSEET